MSIKWIYWQLKLSRMKKTFNIVYQLTDNFILLIFYYIYPSIFLLLLANTQNIWHFPLTSCLIFWNNYQLQFVLLIDSGVWGYPLNHGWLTKGHIFKECGSYLTRNHYLSIALQLHLACWKCLPSSWWTKMLSGLILCRFCVVTHRCYVLTEQQSYCVLGIHFFSNIPQPLLFMNVLVHFLYFWTLDGKGMTEISHLWLSIPWPFILYISTSFEFLCQLSTVQRNFSYGIW